MARIPDKLPGSKQLQTVRARVGSGLSAGLKELASAGEYIGGMLRQRAEQEKRNQDYIERERGNQRRAAQAEADRLDNANAMLAAREKWGEDFAIRSKELSGSGTGFRDQFDADFESYVTETLEGVSESRRSELDLQLRTFGLQLSGRAMEVEMAQNKAHALGSASDMVERYANIVRSDPGQLNSILEEQALAFEGLDLPLDQRDELIDDAAGKVAASAIEGRIGVDPDELIAELDAGLYDDVLTPAVKDRVLDMSRAEIERRQAAAKRAAEDAEREAAARQRQADIMTAIEQASFADSHVASLAASGVGVEEFDRAAFERVATPKQWDVFLKREKAAIAAHASTADMHELTPAEISERVASAAPEPGASDYSSKLDVLNAVAGQAEQVLAERARDPAAYMIRHNSVVRDAAEAMSAAREEEGADVIKAGEAYARAQLGQQEALGVPRSQRSVLSREAAQGMLNEMLAAADEDRGQAMLSVVQSVRLYGEHMPQVMMDLKRAGLPPDAEAILGLEGDPVGQRKFARAVNSWESLKKIVSERDRRQLRTNAERHLRPLLESFEGTDAFESLEVLAMDSVEKLATLYHSNGMGKGEAAKAAAKTFTDRYVLVGSARIPAHVAQQQVPQLRFMEKAFSGKIISGEVENHGFFSDVPYTARQHIEVALEDILEDISSRDYAGDALLAQIGDARLSDEDRKALTADAVRATGRWVTNEDETGVYLVIGDGMLSTPVYFSEDKRVEYEWGALIGRGRIDNRTSDPSAPFAASVSEE